MALSYDEYVLRLNKELNLLGAFDSDVSRALITDALIQFCRLVEPEISASLSIVAGTTEYDVPTTIDKIIAMFNTSGTPVVYSLNSHSRKITLQDAPDEATTYTMYGTPKNVKTNYQTIIAGLNENYYDALWSFIKWAAHDQTDSAISAQKWQEARALARELRQERNGDIDSYSQAVRFMDVQGNMIDDSSNADGVSPVINDYLESDL